MKVALLGGGGFRTPLTVGALRRAAPGLDLRELVLYDVDADRLRTMHAVVDAAQAGECSPRVRLSATTHLTDALRDADYVLCAIRVGGLSARAADERIAIEAGVVGQETVGAGGLCLVMRSVAIMSALAEEVARVAPHAWFINFTNPVGAISGVLRETLGERVIGVCDTPAEMIRRVADVLDRPVPRLRFDYFGLNHLGWLRGVYDDHDDSDFNLLPGLLADAARLEQLEETRLFGATCIRRLELLPSEYLTYYYAPDRHLAAVARTGYSRAEYLLDQQREFYASAALAPDQAAALWHAARSARDRTYLSDAGHSDQERPTDAAADGYAAVAAAVVAALATNTPLQAIVDVANGDTLSFLPAHATVEVPCVVDATGATPRRVDPVSEHALDLMQRVYAAEQAAIRAARTRSHGDALAALAAHPLIDSTARAERLFGAYLRHHADIAAIFA